MSGPPKRSHDEGSHVHSASSKYPHEAAYPKLTSGVSNEYHPHEIGPDAHAAKLPRTESWDADRRSPLHSVYRVPPPPSSDSHLDSHPVVPESRLDARDSKGNRDHRVEMHDPKGDGRDLYGEAKRDSQSAKGEKDVRYESRGGDNKEIKHDREAHPDPKNETKIEKDGFGSASGQLNWKEPKEYHRGKRYSDSLGGHVEPWHVPRVSPQHPVDTAKESVTNEEFKYKEWPERSDRDKERNEAVGENKVDSKGDDRFKDKDRKRKDLKYREWSDRSDQDKEQNDRRSNIQLGNSSGDGKEPAREERESERWDKERKDLSKERERIKEREKEHPKREPLNGVEKDGLRSEKEFGDVSARVPGQDNTSFEQKKSKDIDGWNNSDKEGREKKKERDADMEGDKIEKQSRPYEKDSDEGCADVEGSTEREAFNYSLQQHKRLLRPRGSPQLATHEPRFRAHPQEHEGSQGKSEVSSVVYKVGECMKDLIKLWEEYKSSQSDKNVDTAHTGPTLEIRIPAEYVTATNRQVKGGQLWGTDIYTDDSDLVAVLMHTGYCRPTSSPPPPAIQELRATIRILPPQDSYSSMLINNVRSRAWGAGIGCSYRGCSYRVERCCIVKKGGGTIDLEPSMTHTSALEPTLTPVAVERAMTTRAAASNALRQQRYVREVTIQYNLCNEPWIKYSISVVADKGLKKPQYTSARLKKGEVLYCETHSCRYELCFTGDRMVKALHPVQAHQETDKAHNHHTHPPIGERNDSENVLIDVFRWSRCKKPLPQKVMQSVGIPLPLEYVEVLEDNLEWDDVQWSQTGVWIAGKEYTLARVHFLSPN